MWLSAFTEKSCAVSGALTWNQANEASGFELRVIKAGTSRPSACAQPVSFGFGSTGFGKVCLTPNKSIKTVYHFCSIGSVNTGTLLSSAILAACNCCRMPQELQGQVLSAGLKLAKCFVLFGPLCEPGTCVAWKVSFPPSNESLMSVVLAVNCMKLSGLRSVRTTGPFISFKNRLHLALVRGPTWGFACHSCIWPALCNSLDLLTVLNASLDEVLT